MPQPSSSPPSPEGPMPSPMMPGYSTSPATRAPGVSPTPQPSSSPPSPEGPVPGPSPMMPKPSAGQSPSSVTPPEPESTPPPLFGTPPSPPSYPPPPAVVLPPTACQPSATGAGVIPLPDGGFATFRLEVGSFVCCSHVHSMISCQIWKTRASDATVATYPNEDFQWPHHLLRCKHMLWPSSGG